VSPEYVRIAPLKRRSLKFIAWLFCLLFFACARPPNSYQRADHYARNTERGIASWYGKKFHGRRTASGERYNMHQLTAAHPKAPFGTVVQVRNLANGRAVTVRINDRGPFKDGRIIDLSYAAAKQLGMLGSGTAKVEVRPVQQ
jgi:rare lipoprotein A